MGEARKIVGMAVMAMSMENGVNPLQISRLTHQKPSS